MLTPMKSKWIHLALLLTGLGVLVWSGIAPYDRVVWVAEASPAVIGAIIFLAVYRRFRFTTLAYALAWFFSLILIVGGHYTYARVPVGCWLQDGFGLARNHYDRFGHFFQGVAPAILTRELLLRTSPLRPGKWLFVLVASVCLAISAAYELIEWAAAVLTDAEQFLATQGDIWDAQWDMFLCLCGAVVAQLIFSRWHDRSIKRVLAV